MNIFTPASNDQSIFYLGHIFGLVGNLFAINSGDPLPTLPSLLFSTFNTFALVLGTLMVTYVTIVGVMTTAHEGEFMGKKWSGMWIPIRMTMGIVGLFPTKSGYCAIQLIIMWIILQGVGAADKMWGVVISYLNLAGSPYQGIQLEGAQIKTPQQLQFLFQGLVCQRTARAQNSNAFYCADNPSSSFCTADTKDLTNIIPNTTGGSTYSPASTDGTTITYSMGPPDGKCGKLTYNDPAAACSPGTPNSFLGRIARLTYNSSSNSSANSSATSLACLAAKGQQQALTAIVATFDAIAEKFATADADYSTFFNTPNDCKLDPNSTIPGSTKVCMKSEGVDIVNQPMFIIPWIQNYCTNTLQTPMPLCYGRYKGVDKDNSSKDLISLLRQPPLLPTATDDKSATNADKDAIVKVFPNYSSLLSAKNNFINASVGEYIATITSVITDYISSQAGNSKNVENGRLRDALDQGWITAGANYYQITASSNRHLQDAIQSVSFSVESPTSPVNIGSNGDGNSNYRTNYEAANVFVNNLAQQGNNVISNIPPELSNVTSNVQSSLMNTFQKCIKGGADGGTWRTNTMKDIASFGYILMILAQVLFAVTLVVVFVLVTVAEITFIVLGTGMPVSPWGEGVKALVFFILPFFVAVLTALYLIGATLGIYVPLIPYIVFTVAAIGWFIAVIEAMIAGPIIALGILSPAGQHELLGRAEASVNMLLNLFLRPTLMVLGLLMSMFLVDVLINLINTGFLPVTEDIGISSPGLFEEIVFIAVYTVLIVTAVNKAFSLIYEIPNRVLTWIGGQAVSHGEAEALGQVKHGVEGAASGISSTGKQAAGGAEQGAESALKAKKNKEDQAAAATAAAANAKIGGSSGT